MKRILILSVLLLLTNSIVAEQWASVYRKKVEEAEVREAEQSNVFVFAKHNIPMFTQLLCSWNAVRPSKGHLVFYVQARNAHTKKWGSWHRMLEWGDIQRSFATKSDGFTKYVHVRLETEPLQLANAFRVKVVGAKGALLRNMKGLVVTTANMYQFKPEELRDERLNALSSVYVKQVPQISQIALNHPESNRICSPVSCTMLTQYLTGLPIDPESFAKWSYDKGLKIYGSWPFNMAHAFEWSKGGNWFYNTRLNSFTQLYGQLKRGLPVVVSVRGQLPNAQKSFPNGHLLVVVGWDAQSKEVLCHDPSASEHTHVLQRYSINEFIQAWERSRRLTYWVEPIKQKDKLFMS